MYRKITRTLLIICASCIMIGMSVKQTTARTKPLYELPELLKESDGKIRYYVHYDALGNLPDSSYLERLSDKIRVFDEVEIRYYPTLLFHLTSRRLNLPKSMDYDSSSVLIVFPPQVTDTATIDVGIGVVYMLALEGSIFRLRSTPAQSHIKPGEAVPDTCSIYREVLSGALPQAEAVTEKSILPANVAKNWEGKIFRHVNFKPGVLYFEIYTLAGKEVYLEARFGPYVVMELFDGVRVDHYVNVGQSTTLPMIPRRDEGFYTATITGADLKAGMHGLNIRLDYKVGTFEQRMSPTNYQNVPFKGTWDQIAITAERELPSDFRIRPGICSFNSGREVRLVTSFLFIRNPKSYFSENPEWQDYFNPSFGLQIGGTGDQDLVLLLGGSIRASKVGDIVFGFRFGLNPNLKWKGGENYYFGATIDPELFKIFSKTNQ